MQMNAFQMLSKIHPCKTSGTKLSSVKVYLTGTYLTGGKSQKNSNFK